MDVLARRLVLGLGGKMAFPSWIATRLPAHVLPVCSDTILRRGGLEAMLGHIRKVKSRITVASSGVGKANRPRGSSGASRPGGAASSGRGATEARASMASVLSPALRNKLSMPPTVVIIGGSHSAWSVACLLLEGSRRGMQPEANMQDKVSDMLHAFSRGTSECGYASGGDRGSGLKFRENTARGHASSSRSGARDQRDVWADSSKAPYCESECILWTIASISRP